MSLLSETPDNLIDEMALSLTPKVDRAVDSDDDSLSEHSDDEDIVASNVEVLELTADGQEKIECISKNAAASLDIIQVKFSDTNDCRHVLQRDACIENAVEISWLDEKFCQSNITDENETMDCKTSQVSVSDETKDTDISCSSLLEQPHSNQEKFNKSSMLTSDTYMCCEYDGNDLNNSVIPSVTSGASKHIISEGMTIYPECKGDGDVDFICNNDLPVENTEAKGQLDTIPFLEQLLEDEQEVTDKQLKSPQSEIPDFVILLQSNIETGCVENMGENFNDRSGIDLLNEMRNELICDEDSEDLGLKLLYDESKIKRKFLKSKNARKRKKQLRKFQKVAYNQTAEDRKQKFAQSFQELKMSQIDIEEYGIDSSITCPVCLEMYHLPSTCNPCGHVFCDPCLRRLTTQCSEGIPCPLCRTIISTCDLNKDFDEYLLLTHPVVYSARVDSERLSKYRHYKLPYTPPVPLGKRIMRQLIASRNSQSDSRWMSHDWFKFLLGCTVGMCLSLLLMLFNRVKSVRDARDVNIVFLSLLIGASVTFLIFKFIKI